MRARRLLPRRSVVRTAASWAAGSGTRFRRGGRHAVVRDSFGCRGLLAVALLAAAALLLREWYRSLPDPRPAPPPVAEARPSHWLPPPRPQEPEPPPPTFGERLAAWRPGADRATALLAGRLLLAFLGAGGGRGLLVAGHAAAGRTTRGTSGAAGPPGPPAGRHRVARRGVRQPGRPDRRPDPRVGGGRGRVVLPPPAARRPVPAGRLGPARARAARTARTTGTSASTSWPATCRRYWTRSAAGRPCCSGTASGG